MLKEEIKLATKIKQGIDLIIISFSFLLSYFLRNYLSYSFPNLFPPLFPLERYLGLFPLFLFSWWFLLRIQGFYSLPGNKFLTESPEIIIRSGVMVLLSLGGLIFTFKLNYISRTFIFLLVFISTLLLLISPFIFKMLGKKESNHRQILIAGQKEHAANLIPKVMKLKNWGLRIVGLVVDDPDIVGNEIEGIKAIGTLTDLPQIIKENVIDEVIFSVPEAWLSKINPLILACEEAGITVRITLNFFNPLIAKYSLGELEGIPLLSFLTLPKNMAQLFVKQLFDYLGAFFLVLLLSPLFLLIAIMIKISSPGPVIFKQIRCGLNGRKFTFYKFRSMIANAEEIKPNLEELNEATGPVFKIKNDPRVTSIGRFLRKTSIDELPQLFNVLKGDMSLVGPRPPLPSEVEKYEWWQRRRLSMKPGLTCIWQVSGRSKLDFDTWMKMDLEYIDNWSLGLDFKILFKTIPAVLSGKGAM